LSAEERIYRHEKLVGELSEPDEPIHPQMEEAFKRAVEREKSKNREDYD
jgi:hypothetical protein